MARVGWRVKVQFDDGTWYGGEITKLEDGPLLKQVWSTEETYALPCHVTF